MNIALTLSVIIVVVTTSCHLLSILEDMENALCNLEKKVLELEKINRNEINDGK